MKIDYNKTLEQLERSYWPEYNEGPGLVQKCHDYRKIKLKELTIENMRLLIGQNIGLPYLIPIALQKLNADILIDGDFYEGDFLMAVLHSDKKYWMENKSNTKELIRIFELNQQKLQEYDTLESIKRDWFYYFNVIKKSHYNSIK